MEPRDPTISGLPSATSGVELELPRVELPHLLAGGGRRVPGGSLAADLQGHTVGPHVLQPGVLLGDTVPTVGRVPEALAVGEERVRARAPEDDPGELEIAEAEALRHDPLLPAPVVD